MGKNSHDASVLKATAELLPGQSSYFIVKHAHECRAGKVDHNYQLSTEQCTMLPDLGANDSAVPAKAVAQTWN